MKLKISPENTLEWIALRSNLAPTPLVDTQVAFSAARAIMAGAELGIYEALGKKQLSAVEVAAAAQTVPHPTEQLLNCLVGLGYLTWKNNRYALRPKYYKWLLQESEVNVIGKLKFQIMEWDWMAKLEDYVRTGKTLQMHSMASPAEWERYQEGMRDLSINAAKDFAKKMPMVKEPKQMLDIGGSHGLFSIELCKKYPSLRSTILELPGAIESASAIAKRYDTTGRVNYKAGNVLEDDLGNNLYDLVLINNVVHHFTADQNRTLAKKISNALTPGGYFIIGEFEKADKPGEGGAVGATSGLYFSVVSASGNWSANEIQGWQKDAGLTLLKPLSTITLPGWKMFPATKPA